MSPDLLATVAFVVTAVLFGGGLSVLASILIEWKDEE